MPAVLTVEEVADVLRCSRGHVYRLVKGNRLPALPMEGRMTRISRRAVEQFLALSDATAVVESVRGDC